MKIFLGGASGLLGKELVRKLGKEHELIKVSLTGRDQALQCDLSDAAQVSKVFPAKGIDLLLHTAAFSDVDGCEKNPERAYKANALSVKVLSKVCEVQKIPMIYISTDYVFNGKKGSLYSESDSPAPVNIYGITKLAGEAYLNQSNIPSMIVRTSWLFGAGEPKNFVNAILERMKTSNELQVLDDQVDCPTYAKDLAETVEGLIPILLNKKDKSVFHVCNQGETTRLEMTQEMKKILKKDYLKVNRMDASQIQNRIAVRPDRPSLSTDKVQKLLSRPMRPWQNALADYVGSLS